MRYLSHAWQLLQAAASWQAAEVALFLLTSVSLAVKTRALSDAAPQAAATAAAGDGGDENGGSAAMEAAAAPGAARAAATAEDRQQTQTLLAALFGSLCCAEGAARMVVGAHPALADGAVAGGGRFRDGPGLVHALEHRQQRTVR